VGANETCIDFEQPFYQAFFTFAGETTCLVAYFIMEGIIAWKRRREGYISVSSEDAPEAVEDPKPKAPRVQGWSYLLFAIPAACDVVGTSLMNMGLIYTHASVYQMLRGIVVVFTATLASFALKRKHYPYHWTGVVRSFVALCRRRALAEFSFFFSFSSCLELELWASRQSS